jgi:hypothetical protein
MRALGYTELTSTELPDELRFTVVRHDGWFDWFRRTLAPVGVIFFLCVPDPRLSWGVRFAFIFVAISPMPLYWFRGRTTELRVTSGELIVTGNLRNLFSSRATMLASKVTWLGFNEVEPNTDGLRIEGEDADIDCALPELNREQAEAISDTILRRFRNIRPDFPR